MLPFMLISAGLTLAAAYLWGKYGLSRLEFTHHVDKQQVCFGEAVEYRQEIVNRKLLPLPWVFLETEIPAETVLRKGSTVHSHKPGRRALLRTLSILWYQKVIRTYHFCGEKRGWYALGPTRVVTGDIFGIYQKETTWQKPAVFVVFPRILPVRTEKSLSISPAGDWERQSFLLQDPFTFTGTRDYYPGDSIKMVDWKATARLSRLQVRQYNAPETRRLAVYLNVNTFENAWEGIYGDVLELAVITAASLMQNAVQTGWEVMLVSNGRMQSENMETELITTVPYGRGLAHGRVLLESLARLNPYSFHSIEEVTLQTVPRLKQESLVIFITAVLTGEIKNTVRLLARKGYRIQLVLIGDRHQSSPGVEGIPTFRVEGEANWREMAELRLVRCV